MAGLGPLNHALGEVQAQDLGPAALGKLKAAYSWTTAQIQDGLGQGGHVLQKARDLPAPELLGGHPVVAAGG
jgi:hypothetical protein